MKFLGPSQHRRLNEVVAFVCLVAGVALTLSLGSYSPADPSWNTATSVAAPRNLTGYPGAFISDLMLNIFGLGAIVFPALLIALGWKWLRSQPIEAPIVRMFGSLVLLLGTSTMLSLFGDWRIFSGFIPAGGLLGLVLADYLRRNLNLTGAAILTLSCLFLSLYLISTFSMATLATWFAGPIAIWNHVMKQLAAWRERRHEAALARKAARAARPKKQKAAAVVAEAASAVEAASPAPDDLPWHTEVVSKAIREEEQNPPSEDYIPIRTLEDLPPEPKPAAFANPPAADPVPPGRRRKGQSTFVLPSTALLVEPPAKNPFDEQELKDTAGRIKSKFEEFNVFGSVVQINPGPVVTTFEFKPEAGIKYTRITTLSEDLCMGLQAESILIERIPGKPTVGIEVPNSRREVISFRQIIESDEFQGNASRMTVALGKDINGRIRVATLETMPHLLIAGSTGSGKSVMLNTLIMSLLYKSTPDEVRMILIDPKRLEMGLYENIPHLLTPVITDAKKATNALRNAVLEMERRLKLLAAQGVRNIDQYNKKVRAKLAEPRSLFDEAEPNPELEELRPLPYILIIIDELADLMMLERANVEESVTRLAQMARAVGMHLVLATQRPSVDVITGLIKANFPARISFRVATRVDSRTILDVMGAEHLLGKGDMLFLPPGSSRLTRVHGSFITESEINKVVDFWKEQAQPEYDQTFLIAPPSDDDEEPTEFDGEADPLYQDAVRVVLEVGKASTSVLQRRLRLGYGRAARILDMMQHEGIIGPPDGSKPRDVLKRPDWLEEVESSLR